MRHYIYIYIYACIHMPICVSTYIHMYACTLHMACTSLQSFMIFIFSIYLLFLFCINSTCEEKKEKVKQKSEGSNYTGQINVGENYQVSNVSTFFLNSHSEKYDGICIYICMRVFNILIVFKGVCLYHICI